MGYSPWSRKELDMTERLSTAHSTEANMGFSGGSVVKDPTANAGDAGVVDSISRLGRCPGVGNGKPL